MKKIAILLLCLFVTAAAHAQNDGSAASGSGTPVVDSKTIWQETFGSDLIDVGGKAVSPEVLQNKIVGIYFSAHWCPPCRAFSPELVKFRNAHKDQFEVVFVSSDKDAAAQKQYMEELKMEWPAVKFGSPIADKLSEKYGVEGIPTLVIVDPKFNTISTEGREEVTENAEGCLDAWKEKAGL